MNDRWQQVKRLFHAAVEREPHLRSAFLDEACGGDQSLRQEVESLIAAHEQPAGIIDQCAVDVAIDLFAADPDETLAGRDIGPYKIIEQIGRGGMGEVYLAQDTRLGRRVALKLLPPEFTRNEDRVRRFKQEARAASALNHPNILTIHEIGQLEGAYFIATEYIEGCTLRSLIDSGTLALDQTIDIIIQVATALGAAHSAGIIHRDIKPENIMLRPDGYVKVLDFGLAKLSQQKSHSGDIPTFAAVDTNPGMVLGTVSYMSPEQARAQPLDARTDIFSLGVVLYEMITGHLPFEAASAIDVMSSILNAEPPPLTKYWEAAPEQLQYIVSKALSKDPQHRHQSVSEFSSELKKFRQELDLGDKLNESTSGGVSGARRIATSGQYHALKTGEKLAALTGQVATHQTLSIRPLINQIFRQKKVVAFTAITISLLVIALGVAVYQLIAPSKPINSIAVLPFTNAIADQSAEYLPDGITENIINNLSQLPGLRVMARNTVFTYKGKEVDPRRVGEELSVRAVVMGRITQQGDRLVIGAELIDASDGKQLWGEQYNRNPDDILSIQEEIAKQISEKLRLRLNGEQQQKLAKHNTENTEAYIAYIKGRYNLYNNFTRDEAKKAIELFNQAIRIDPTYALAYSGMADTYYAMSNLYLPPSEAMPKARTLAMRAIEIDDSLAEAHASLGVIKAQYDWDWPEAEKEYKRAIELNPGYAQAREWYGIFLVIMGRFDEARAEFEQARQLNPLSGSIAITSTYPYLYGRQYDEASRKAREIIQMNPDLRFAHSLQAMCHVQSGRFSEASAEIQQALQSGRDSFLLGDAGYIYGVWGKKAEAQKVLDELMKLSKESYVSPWGIAKVYSGLGDKDKTFEWLEKAYQLRDEEMVMLNVSFWFDSVRSDPRFTDLLRRMRLAP